MIRHAALILLGAGLLLLVGWAALTFFGGGKAPNVPFVDRKLPPVVGQSAPQFTLNRLEGGQVSLQGLQGKAVLINFWATWCPPCREEMPLLQKTAQKYSDRLVVLGVNEQEGPDVIRPFVNELGISFPILLDQDGSISDRYYVHNYPSSFFVDPQGVLRGQKIGQLTEENILDYLKTVGIEP